MASYSVARTAHKTLSTTVADTVYFSSADAKSLAVYNANASNDLYCTPNPTSETQTITLSAGAQNDTFKLTWNGNESSAAVTIPVGGFASTTAAQVLACLLTITGVASGDVSVTGTGTLVVVFAGLLRGQDVGAITITTKTGAANGSVAETVKGGAVAAADGTYRVAPLQTKILTLQPVASYLVSVVGSGNAYSVETN